MAEVKSKLTGFSSLLNVPTTAAGTQELRELFNEAVFDFPKPKGLLMELIKQGTNAQGGDIVLDFFAGSGTTGEAVLHVNKDGGNRKFILIQLPEKTTNTLYPTIAHITRDRIRRVISRLHKASTGKFDMHNQSANAGFRAFQLDASNFKLGLTHSGVL